eukprot:CAMPEP_0175855680 /NCGR_PEP_ID=MMETSP0107_2-20121207/28061_1 /TAXON_ID=195067 ORGANISM="Goniomonas pacifica, Strain CCMP1869" /NCGR_SAMPLE_ID=MMETSP0107_2 /ASSEMBLY_ACC=CAM_ASM_000203 /LENGTH=50 /DNA_ID=CAMNT_0017171669 /DNA_START=305 /DNA_END=454 /DNA_ORIENTATION=-
MSINVISSGPAPSDMASLCSSSSGTTAHSRVSTPSVALFIASCRSDRTHC